MTYFSSWGWVALSAIAAAGIVAFLHVLARQSESARAVVRLRIDADSLRKGYAQRLAALRAREAGGMIEVEPVEDRAAESELRAAA
jgi:hypothetical protein